MELRVRGRPVQRAEVPDAALPDCPGCDKPELDEEDVETAMLYGLVSNQQTWNYMSGQRMGLRLEAVISAVRWYHGRGLIQDPDRVMERIWIIDRAVNDHFNAQLQKDEGAKGER